jgi:acyl dehydratase
MFLEDLTVGQIFRTGTAPVELERSKAFGAEFDPQPFHLDWHTAALTMRLVVNSDFKISGGLVGAGVEQIRWPRPVRPGDILRVESEVLEVRPSRSRPDRGIVRVRMTTLNQDGDAVMEQIASLIVPREPGRAAGSSGE